MDMSVCADCGVTTPWTLIALACIAATACLVVARKLAKHRSPLGRVSTAAFYLGAAAFVFYAFML